jgi:hypothetical protein
MDFLGPDLSFKGRICAEPGEGLEWYSQSVKLVNLTFFPRVEELVKFDGLARLDGGVFSKLERTSLLLTTSSTSLQELRNWIAQSIPESISMLLLEALRKIVAGKSDMAKRMRREKLENMPYKKRTGKVKTERKSF